MRSEPRPRNYAVVLVAVSCGAVAALLFAALLFLQLFTAHGSPAGNVLRLGLAILSLFLGLFLLAAAVLYRHSFDKAQSDDFHS